MKKVMILTVLILVLIGAVFADDYYTYQTGVPQANISEETARQIALKHAGLSVNQVGFLSSHQEYDDGSLKYEIKFYNNNTEYEYDIDAVSGVILSFDKDYKYYPTIPVSQTEIEESKSQTGTLQYQVPVSSKDVPIQTETQVLNGSAAVLATNSDFKHISFAGRTLISKQNALAIAAGHANLVEKNLSKIKIKQEYEYGRTVYEVKFRSGNLKYEYDIDAFSGQVLKAEIDD